MYSLDDLQKAKDELEYWNERFANDSSSNPNKHSSQIKSSRAKVREITEFLKSSGVIELTDKEKLENSLNNAFPNARSNQVVQFNGVEYKRKFFPLEWSNSRKTITVWGKRWDRVEQTNSI